MNNQIYILLISIFLLGCGTEEPQLTSIQEGVVTVGEVVEISDLSTPEINCMTHYFQTDLKDESFRKFYWQLIKDLRVKDTVALLDAFAEAVGFSKYECWDGEWIQGEECDGCAKCSKRGIIKGTFGSMPLGEVCVLLEKQISCYGVGPLKHGHWFMENIKGQGPYYSNLNFLDHGVEKKLYGYEAVLVLKDSVPVFSQPSGTSKIVGFLPAKPVYRSLDVGEDRWNEEEKVSYTPHYLGETECFIESMYTLNGFGYTKIIFGKVKGEWKITYVLQPPGC